MLRLGGNDRVAKSCLTPKWTPAGETATGSAGPGCSPPCWCGCRAGGCCRRCCSRGPRGAGEDVLVAEEAAEPHVGEDQRLLVVHRLLVRLLHRHACLAEPLHQQLHHERVVGAAWSARARPFQSREEIIIIGGSCHTYHFGRDKSFVVATKLFFAAKKTSLRQTRVCRDKHKFKHHFVATKDVFCRDKIMFVTRVFFVTNIILSRQNKNDTCGSSCQ